MAGILYGIGTGPGDPELMTLKSIRIIKESDVIALPISDCTVINRPKLVNAEECGKDFLMKCVAFSIAYHNIPQILEKKIVLLPMPMNKDKEELKKIHNECSDVIEQLINQNNQIAFLTIGDPTIYSTYLYLHNRMKERHLPVGIINGIPSFCASAARMGMGLVENKEQLHILPSSYDIEKEIQLKGTKVLMKAGTKMAQVKGLIREKDACVHMIENCGMPGERIYTSVEQIPDCAGYYSLLILKD